MITRVGFDVDGVIACFFKSYEDLVVEVAGEDLFPARFPAALPQCWNWPESFGYSKKVVNEVWNRIKSDPTFWTRLQPLQPKSVNSRIDDLVQNKKAYRIFFISNRPGINTLKQTEDFLAVSCGIKNPYVIISEEKGRHCQQLELDFYIDDKKENIEDVENLSPDTHAYLLRYPYNATATPRLECDTVADFLEYI